MNSLESLALPVIARPETSAVASAKDAAGGPSEEALEAGRQFEAVMVRTLLKPMEKSLGFGDSGSSGSIYSSVAVDAMADAIANAGGLGLGEILAASLGGGQEKPAESKE